MLVVDTSVWIDFFNGADTPGAARLDAALGQRHVLLCDLVLAELLSGFATDREAKAALDWLSAFECVTIGGPDVAIAAASNYRHLRRKGATVRKTIDLLIGTWCLMHDHELLHSDRDFEPLSRHLGLRVLA
jgi:predicted nucleic acid-binding protein